MPREEPGACTSYTRIAPVILQTLSREPSLSLSCCTSLFTSPLRSHLGLTSLSSINLVASSVLPKPLLYQNFRSLPSLEWLNVWSNYCLRTLDMQAFNGHKLLRRLFQGTASRSHIYHNLALPWRQRGRCWSVPRNWDLHHADLCLPVFDILEISPNPVLPISKFLTPSKKVAPTSRRLNAKLFKLCRAEDEERLP
jgi:hypothetical protein